MLSLLADCSDRPDGPYPCGEYQAFHLCAEIELHE
jgi:hypothetical protein